MWILDKLLGRKPMKVSVEGPASLVAIPVAYWKGPNGERPPEKTERNAALVRRYTTDTSSTIHSLGKEFGISGARVQQILVKKGVTMRGTGRMVSVRKHRRAPESVRKQAARLHVKEGMTYSEIATRLGRSIPSVGRAVRKYKSDVKLGWSDDRKATLSDLWGDHSWTPLQIAQLLDTTESAVRVQASRLGLRRVAR